MQTNNFGCVCLDAEFVEGDELIELSIFALDRTRIYSQRFKPERYKNWDSSIHHITPEMVADSPSFNDCCEQIQRLIDEADHIIGFAVDNDTSHLSRQGVSGLEEKSIIELRDWFWINHGLRHDLDLYQGISLERVVNELGVTFGSDGMHSASGDTLATLDSFLILFNRFCTDRSLDPELFNEAIERFNNEYAGQKEEYDRTHAEGYAILLKTGPDGYSLRVRREEPTLTSRVAASIRVADRKRAEVELRAYMARRPLIGKGIYRLQPKDIEWFKAYTNGFDSDEHALFNKLSKLQSRFNVTSLKHR